MNEIYNEDCFETFKRLEDKSIDLILTSPPYNANRHDSGVKNKQGEYIKRYDCYRDNKTEEEYTKWTIDIFKNAEKFLKDDAVILWNLSYTFRNPSLPMKIIIEIEKNTNFKLKETIIWKKKCAMPVHSSPTYLTRFTEFIFVFSKQKLYHTNKIGKIGKNNQIYYNTFSNFIEASNNDGPNDINKATFSTDLVIKLLDIYGRKEGLLYDPFIGIGTSAKGAKKWGMNYIGSEISKKQIEYYYENKIITR